MRSVEEHRAVVAALITRRAPAAVPVREALGLVLASDVVAPLALPGFDNSAMGRLRRSRRRRRDGITR